MTPDRWRQVKELLWAALEQESASRAEWLERACAGDESLHREVESLINACEGPSNFLDVPAMERTRVTLPVISHWPGRIVGRYRILEEIGRGGMSAVFRATRIEEQFEHEVAIKLLHRSHDSDILMRRFRAERQILARLSHPNIAHLLDGDSTEEGVPYLVMEYVRGEPIDAWCERRKLGLVARLRLFRTLCDAVHHVHRHLMVHGDIKCSNVLVNEDGIVKLLDFGIARLLDPEHGASSHHHTTTVALTPESASPEQIRNEPLTTASDVYSLGVLLYRLLTGMPVYQPDSDAYYDLARHICEMTPERPSDAVANASNPPATARQLRGDLDTIVLKALNKDPQQRYASVEQLSHDVALHLGGFPVVAAPESTRYRLRKFVGRNRALTGVGVLLALSMVTGIVATSWQAHIAQRERVRAERHFEDVRGLAQTFMLDVHDSITNLPGALPVREKIITHSLRYLDTLAQERADDPGVRRDLARAYERIGDLQSDMFATNLANNEAALASLRKSYHLRESLWEQGEHDIALLRERIILSLKLAQYSQANRATGDAMRYAHRAVEMTDSLPHGAQAISEDIRARGAAHIVLGTLQAMGGALDAGLREMNQGIRIYEERIRSGDMHLKIRRNLGNALCRSGDLLSKVGGRHEPSYPLHLRSLEIFEQLVREYPLDTDLQQEAAFVLMDTGNAAALTGRVTEGLQKRQQAVDRLRSLSRAEPQREDFRYSLGWALGELAISFSEQSRYADAGDTLEEAQTILNGLSGASAARLNGTHFLIAVHDMRLGEIRMAQAKASRTAQLWQEARALLERSAKVFAAAKDDPVLAAEALEHAQSIEASLQACEKALRS